MVDSSGFQTCLDQFQISLWCRDAAFRFLLKRVQHIDGRCKPYRLDGPISLAVVACDNLQNASPAEPLEDLGIGMPVTLLRRKKCVANVAAHLERHGAEIWLAARHPAQRFDAVHDVSITVAPALWLFYHRAYATSSLFCDLAPDAPAVTIKPAITLLLPLAVPIQPQALSEEWHHKRRRPGRPLSVAG